MDIQEPEIKRLFITNIPKLKYILLAIMISSLFYVYEIFATDESEEQSLNDAFQIQISNNGTFFSDLNSANLINITNNELDSVYAQIATMDDNLYLIWQESVDDNSEERNYEIYFKKSLDNGNTFSETVNVSNNPGFSEHPQIAVSENGIFMVWVDNSNSNNTDILFSKSLDNGESFSKPIKLNTNSKDANNLEISAFNENVYVVWQEIDKTSSNIHKKISSNIMFRNSLDNGETFLDVIKLTNNTKDSYPKVASYLDNVYVVWNNENKDTSKDFTPNGLFFIKSSDNGNSFDKIDKIAQNNFGEAQISAFNNEVFVIWGGLHSKNINEIYFVESLDNGNSFTNPGTILEKVTKSKDKNYSYKINHPTNVEIASNDPANMVWQGVISKENQDIFITNIKNSFDATEILNLSNNTDISECPQIAVTEKYIYVVWEDSTPGNHEIFFARGEIQEDN